MTRFSLHSKGWFPVKRLIGLVLSFSVLVVLLGTQTGCPDNKAKPPATKDVKDVVKDTVKDTVKDSVKDTVKDTVKKDS